MAGVFALAAAPAEAAETYEPTRFDDPAPGMCLPADCSLREALGAANSDSDADTIILRAGTYTNAAAFGQQLIAQPVTIRGAGARATTIDGGGPAVSDRVLEVTTGPAFMQDLTVTGGVLSGDDGAGLLASGGPLTLTRVALTKNLGTGSGYFGGGIQNESANEVTLIDSAVTGNRHQNGAGLSNAGGASELLLRNVTVSDNIALGFGGGINMAGTISASNSTIAGNRAGDGGFGDGGGISSVGTATLSNTILAGNTVTGGAVKPDCEGTVDSDGNNLIGNDAGCIVMGGGGDQVGTPASPIDPKLGPLADNGGPTDTRALLAGSPAIDEGKAGGGPAACEAGDQRGLSRSLGGKRCDVGAYELIRCLDTAVNRIGRGGDDSLIGTSAADGFLLFGGNDVATGLGGADRACGSTGRDSLIGGAGADQLLGESGADRLKGGGGKDRLLGGAGGDRLFGGAKRDRLLGGAGGDRLFGGGGRDVCRGGAGRDRTRAC